ncbi:MAG: AzlD domain-containing protein [Oscillospiraceae bacterium]
MDNYSFFTYLAVCAGVTYLVRMLPLVLIKKKITNRFLLSFLHYIPYAVLSVMTVPACFYATGSVISAAVGFGAALFLAFNGKGLLPVAAGAAAAVFVTELLTEYVLPMI